MMAPVALLSLVRPALERLRKRGVGQSPEDDLLRHVQGVVAA